MNGAAEAGIGAVPGRSRIALHRAVAVITADQIVIRQTRAGMVAPLVELALTGLAAAAIVRFINSWPLGLLFVLVLVATVLGPLALIGFVNNVVGSSFLMERAKRSARWQQGLLGLGIGTFELVPFERIGYFQVRSDLDIELASGMDQDVVDWEVTLVKDSGRELTVGRVLAARPLATEAGRRANALATALAQMSDAAARLAALPPDPESEESTRTGAHAGMDVAALGPPGGEGDRRGSSD